MLKLDLSCYREDREQETTPHENSRNSTLPSTTSHYNEHDPFPSLPRAPAPDLIQSTMATCPHKPSPQLLYPPTSSPAQLYKFRHSHPHKQQPPPPSSTSTTSPSALYDALEKPSPQIQRVQKSGSYSYPHSHSSQLGSSSAATPVDHHVAKTTSPASDMQSFEEMFTSIDRAISSLGTEEEEERKEAETQKPPPPLPPRPHQQPMQLLHKPPPPPPPAQLRQQGGHPPPHPPGSPPLVPLQRSPSPQLRHQAQVGGHPTLHPPASPPLATFQGSSLPPVERFDPFAAAAVEQAHRQRLKLQMEKRQQQDHTYDTLAAMVQYSSSSSEEDVGERNPVATSQMQVQTSDSSSPTTLHASQTGRPAIESQLPEVGLGYLNFKPARCTCHSHSNPLYRLLMVKSYPLTHSLPLHLPPPPPCLKSHMTPTFTPDKHNNNNRASRSSPSTRKMLLVSCSG